MYSHVSLFSLRLCFNTAYPLSTNLKQLLICSLQEGRLSKVRNKKHQVPYRGGKKGSFPFLLVHPSTAGRLAEFVEHQTAVREVAGSNLGRTITQGLQITEKDVLPL